MGEKKNASSGRKRLSKMDNSSNDSYDSLPMKDLNEEEIPFLGTVQRQELTTRKKVFLLWLPSILILSTSIALVIFSVLKRPTDVQCARVLSPYSPALEAVAYETYTFQNNFTQPSIYRGPPTPEREAAWDDLTHSPAINIPMNKLHLLNKSTEVDWIRTPEDAGGGVAGLLEVMHQLHCLSLLRRWSYREWYEEAPIEFEGPEDLMRGHIDHCIEILRVHLMCASDVTPVLVMADETVAIKKRADFESLHKCRNFSKIKEWMWSHMAMP